MEIILAVVVFAVAVAAVVIGIWLLGFQLPPRHARPHPEPTQDRGTVPLPADLPPAVRRYYEAIVPPGASGLRRTDTAVLWGRSRQRLFVGGRRLWVNVTWREKFLAGLAFYWTGTVRWFWLPFGQGHDFYREGHAEFRFGHEAARSRQLDQAECLRLWAETVWMPSAWLNDWQVHWRNDDSTDPDPHRAVLDVPGPAGGEPERLEVWFDSDSGFIDRFEAARFRASGDEAPSRWTVTCLDWTDFRGVRIPARLRLSWDGAMYAELRVDGVEYNVEVIITKNT
jgi:hypothetical protein